MVKFRFIAFAAIAAIALAFHPGAASAQKAGLGCDGYTRALWHGTDGSVNLWILDPALNYVGYHAYGPYAGWSSVALTTLCNNNSYVLWWNTNGTVSIWALDANLNMITSRTFGPIEAWTAAGLGGDASGNIRLLWESTVGQISVWTINPALNLIGTSPVYGPYFGWTL
jgi:hypothetical protein